MEAIIVVAVLAIFILPVAGIISYFKTQKMIRESFSEISSSISDISVKIAQMSTALKEMRVPQSGIPPSPTEEPEHEEEALRETRRLDMETTEPVTMDTVEPFPEPEEIMEPSPEKVIDAMKKLAEGEGEREIFEEPLIHEYEEPEPLPKFIEDIQTILGRIWSWIIVGEEHRRQDISMEYAVASTWLLRLGIIALIGCVGFFLRWSIDRGILGPEGRVAIAVIAGAGLLVAGIRMIGKRYHLLAQGFIGGGIAFLYFATYATGPMYHLLELPFVFGSMALVTITAGVVSIVTGSQLVAILGIIGGYCTPVMLSTGEPSFNELFSYMLLLGLGVLGIAHKKQWRLLNYLAFVCTWALFFGSMRLYEHERDFTVTIVFLSLLFILHSFIVYYYNLIKKMPSTLLEVAHLLINGALFAGTSYSLILEAHGRPWPAVTSIALALFYIAHIYLFLRRRLHDRNLLVVLIGFAGFFTAWAVPLITQNETLTICWSFMGLFFLWVGLRLDSRLLMYMSLLLYGIVAGRLIIWDLPRNFGDLDWYGVPVADYWKGFASRIWMFGLVIGSMFGGTYIYRKHRPVVSSLSVTDENRLPMKVPGGVFGIGMLVAAVLFLFAVVYFEFAAMFSYIVAVQTPVLTLLWAGLGVYTLYTFIKTEKTVLLQCTGIIAVIVLVKLFLFDFGSWNYQIDEWVYRLRMLELFMRLIDFLIVITLFILLFRVCKSMMATRHHELLNFLPVILVFIYATLETNTLFYHKVPLFQAGALSVLWALFAISFLVLGIIRASKVWRYSGLTLFAVVVIKVFIYDLAEMETIYRVIAFMVVGILLIAGSYAYLKASGKFIQKEQETQ